MKITPIKISLLILLASLFLSNCDSGTGPEEKHKDMEITFHRIDYAKNSSEYSGVVCFYHLIIDSLPGNNRDQKINIINDYITQDFSNGFYEDSVSIWFDEMIEKPRFKIKVEKGYINSVLWDDKNESIFPFQSSDSSVFSKMSYFQVYGALQAGTIAIIFYSQEFRLIDTNTRQSKYNFVANDFLFPKSLHFSHSAKLSNRRNFLLKADL